MQSTLTNLGAIRDESVIRFSGGGTILDVPTMVRVSPVFTSFTVPRNHPAILMFDENETSRRSAGVETALCLDSVQLLHLQLKSRLSFRESGESPSHLVTCTQVHL